MKPEAEAENERQATPPDPDTPGQMLYIPTLSVQTQERG